MNRLLDLRFVIGCFFGIVGILLLVYGFMGSGQSGGINKWCGGSFLVFGVVMIAISSGKAEK